MNLSCNARAASELFSKYTGVSCPYISVFNVASSGDTSSKLSCRRVKLIAASSQALRIVVIPNTIAQQRSARDDVLGVRDSLGAVSGVKYGVLHRGNFLGM